MLQLAACFVILEIIGWNGGDTYNDWNTVKGYRSTERHFLRFTPFQTPRSTTVGGTTGCTTIKLSQQQVISLAKSYLKSSLNVPMKRQMRTIFGEENVKPGQFYRWIKSSFNNTVHENIIKNVPDLTAKQWSATARKMSKNTEVIKYRRLGYALSPVATASKRYTRRSFPIDKSMAMSELANQIRNYRPPKNSSWYGRGGLNSSKGYIFWPATRYKKNTRRTLGWNNGMSELAEILRNYKPPGYRNSYRAKFPPDNSEQIMLRALTSTPLYYDSFNLRTTTTVTTVTDTPTTTLTPEQLFYLDAEKRKRTERWSYFRTFGVMMCEILSTKADYNIMKLWGAAETVVVMEYCHRDRLRDIGYPADRALKKFIRNMNGSPVSVKKEMHEKGRRQLAERAKYCKIDIQIILNRVENFYDRKEGRALFKVLYMVHKYPDNHTYFTHLYIVREVVRTLLVPYYRKESSPKRREILELTENAIVIRYTVDQGYVKITAGATTELYIVQNRSSGLFTSKDRFGKIVRRFDNEEYDETFRGQLRNRRRYDPSLDVGSKKFIHHYKSVRTLNYFKETGIKIATKPKWHKLTISNRDDLKRDLDFRSLYLKNIRNKVVPLPNKNSFKSKYLLRNFNAYERKYTTDRKTKVPFRKSKEKTTKESIFNMLHKESSYSDEQDELKAKLSNALRHGASIKQNNVRSFYAQKRTITSSKDGIGKRNSPKMNEKHNHPYYY